MAGYEYEIYNRQTGELAARGTARECADALGVSYTCFSTEKGLSITEGSDPTYIGTRAWPGPGQPCGRKSLPPEERAERKREQDRESKRASRARARAEKARQEKRSDPAPERKTDSWCRNCIYLAGDAYRGGKTCRYQTITGHSRLYKDIQDPRERRLDDPRVCHPGTGCTARVHKKKKGKPDNK